MAVGDVIITIIFIAVIYLIVKWFSGSGSASNAGSNSQQAIRGVNLQMVETIHAAFPDIPPSNIIYSLSRTRSTQATSEEILERGYLPAPPTTFTVPPSLVPPNSQPPAPSTTSKPTENAKPVQSLIDRYGLSSRLPSLKGKEKDDETVLLPSQQINQVDAAKARSGVGKNAAGSAWGETKEKREQGLKERKERMILEARRRMMEKEEANKAQASPNAEGETITSI